MYNMKMMHEHENDALGLDIETISRQGYNNGASINVYTSEMQQPMLNSSRTLFASYGHVTTTTWF